MAKKKNRNKKNNSNTPNSKSNTYKFKNNNKKRNTPKKLDVERILKLQHKDQLKEVSSILKEHIVNNDKLSLKDLAGKHYKEILQLKTVAEKDSVIRWEKESGINYKRNGMSVRKELLYNNELPEYRVKQILNQLELAQNDYGRTSAEFAFFVESDDFYRKLTEMPKKVIGMTWTNMQTQHKENTLIITRLLQGELNGKQYLFSNTIQSFEDNPKMNNSLNLLVNGQVKGLKPIARVDSAGFIPIEFLTEEAGLDIIEDIRMDEKTELYMTKNINHFNHTAKDVIDIALPQEKASQIAHIHMATTTQDALINIAHTSALNIGYKAQRLPINAMNAKNINTYGLKNLSYNQMINLMKEDAEKMYGMEPFERQFNYCNQHYGIINGELPNEIYNDIDMGRLEVSRRGLPKLDSVINLPFLESHGFNQENGVAIIPSMNHQKPPIPRKILLDKIEYQHYLDREEIAKDKAREQRKIDARKELKLQRKIDNLKSYDQKNPGFLHLTENMSEAEINSEFNRMQRFVKYDNHKRKTKQQNKSTQSKQQNNEKIK